MQIGMTKQGQSGFIEITMLDKRFIVQRDELVKAMMTMDDFVHAGGRVPMTVEMSTFGEIKDSE